VSYTEFLFSWQVRALHFPSPGQPPLAAQGYTAVEAKMARVAHALTKQDRTYRGYYEAAIPCRRTSLIKP